MSHLQWRTLIFKRLRERNERENENIRSLIQLHNRLFEQSETLRSENIHLNFQNEKLRQDNLQLQSSKEGGPGGVEASPKAVQALEQKMYRLQEELTDLHRRKSENAQQVIELSQKLQEREKLISVQGNKVAELETELMLTREDLAAKEAIRLEFESVNQLLRDEYQALNLAYTALDEKFRNVMEENRELVERWLTLKAQDAERMNAENDTVIKKKQVNLEEQLKDAAKESKQVILDDKFACSPPMCLTASLPVKAYLRFDAHEGEVNALVYSPHGRIVATGGVDRKVKLWNLSRGVVDLKGTLTGSNAGVTAIDFDGEDSLILGASNDFASRVWTVLDHRLRHTLTGHSGKVTAARFLGESSKIVTGSQDRTLKVWDLRSRACTRTIFAGSSCNDLVPADGAATTIISGHFDKKIRFWDTRTEMSSNEVLMPGKVTSLALSTDRCYLLACVRDDSLKILDLRQNKIVHSFSCDGFHIGTDYTRAVFSPDSTYVACGSTDGGLYIWNASSGKLEKSLKEHSSCVIACAWHPDGRAFVSCDRSKQVISWLDL